jgi:hypothetical protein
MPARGVAGCLEFQDDSVLLQMVERAAQWCVGNLHQSMEWVSISKIRNTAEETEKAQSARTAVTTWLRGVA